MHFIILFISTHVLHFYAGVFLFVPKIGEDFCTRLCSLAHFPLLLLGDDWEHEETFTDDDEAVGNDPEEREDLAPEIPAPPEIKQVLHSERK